MEGTTQSEAQKSALERVRNAWREAPRVCMRTPRRGARRQAARTSAPAVDGSTEAQSAQPAPATPRELADALEETLRTNPSFVIPVREMLRACESGAREEASFLQTMQAQLEASGKLPVEPLSSLVNMLVRHGALEETVRVDGEPYGGTISDVYEDTEIDEESTVLVYEETTEAGRLVLADLSPEKRTYEVFQSHPHLADGLLRTLQLCDREGGLKTRELQDLLDAEGYLYRDERTGIPSIYPSLYGNLLADAGALRWEHAWITTELGRRVAAELAPQALV